VSQNVESSKVELMVGEPIYPRETGSVAAKPESLAKKGKREQLLEVKSLRNRATSRLACKLEALIFSLEGRYLSNAAFASFYLDVGTGVDQIVKRLGDIKNSQYRIIGNDSTHGSRWHKYKDADNSSLRDLQLLSSKIGEAIFVLIEKEWVDIQKGNASDLQNCLKYVRAYDDWWASQSRYVYQIGLASSMWVNVHLKEKFESDESVLLNNIFFDDEDFIELFLGSSSDLQNLVVMLEKFRCDHLTSATHDPVFIFIKKALRVVNGELAILRWARLLKEASPSNSIVSLDVSKREKLLTIKDALRC
jgi:hypothetical protein